VSTETAAADVATDVDAPGAPGAASTASGQPRAYDFRRPTKLSRDHVRILELAFDTLAKQWTTLLTTTLRAVCTVEPGSVQQLTYDEHISALGSPTAMFLLDLDPIPGVGLLDLSLPVAMNVVDHLLGGPGGQDAPQRAFTEIESTLLVGILDRALAELPYAFESVMPLSATVSGIEQSPQFAQAASPSDSFIVASFPLTVGTVSCTATLALPFTEVFAQLEKLIAGNAAGRGRSDKDASSRAVSARLTETAVEVAVVIGPTPVRMADVISLRPGDVVRLGHSLSEPLALVSAGMTFAHAVPGSEGSRMACLIVPSSEVS
jgi:flagellar motor switch protein FliM